MHSMISIVVPIYNAEKHLRECVESILNQTYENIEVILVDDGSFDNCPVICDEYTEKDTRIKVIHKVNGGVSSARNCGIEVSTGEYICFVDADDTITPSYFQSVMKYFSENKDVDLILGKVNCIKDGYAYDLDDQIVDSQRIKILSQIDKYEMIRCAFFIDSKYKGVRGEVWCKAFRKSTLGDLRFDANVEIGEDQIFVAEYLLRCKEIFIVNEFWYNYYIYNDSSMRKKDWKKETKYIAYFRELEKKLKKCIPKEIISEKSYKLIRELEYSYNLSNKSKKKEIEQAIRSCKRYKKDPVVRHYLKCLPFKNRVVGYKGSICNKLGISYAEISLIRMWHKAEK